MIYITRRERFNAAHRLFRPELTDEENLRIFGKCSNPNWHGHNYTLFVTVKGEINPYTGYLVDLKELSRLIHDRVIEKMDHRNLNLEVDFLKGSLASTENITRAIFHELEPGIQELGAALHSIRLEETENNSAEYFGEK